MPPKKCLCKHPNLHFELYEFEHGRGPAYCGSCRTCGRVRCWMSASNYKLIAAGSSPKKGGMGRK